MRYFNKKGTIVLSVVALVLSLNACSNPDAKSQSLFETAQFEEQQMNFKHARQLYNEILSDYPKSASAAKAKERLDALNEAGAVEGP